MRCFWLVAKKKEKEVSWGFRERKQQYFDFSPKLNSAEKSGTEEHTARSEQQINC